MMKPTKLPTNRWLRLMQGLWVCGLLGFAAARPVLAQCPPSFQGPTYVNDAIVVVTCPPQIFATNFINNSVFTLNLSTFTFFETWDTLNYTNNGSMATDAGFRFDTQSSSTFAHSMAGNFYNPGTISCASLTGTFLLGLGGQFIVNATNISMPGGTVVVGMGGGTGGGLISFAGRQWTGRQWTGRQWTGGGRRIGFGPGCPRLQRLNNLLLLFRLRDRYERGMESGRIFATDLCDAVICQVGTRSGSRVDAAARLPHLSRVYHPLC
jgi:hypothetical protein